jgi:hypothetical protein
VLVKMLESKAASLDGSSIDRLEEGEVYEIRDELALRLIDRGSAEFAGVADPVGEAPEPDENSDDSGADGAPEPEADAGGQAAHDEASEPESTEAPSSCDSEASSEDAEPAGDEPAAEPTAEEKFAELLSLKRGELNELAKKSGVEEPEKLANKEAVAQAILDAQENPSE